ncbi:hypothetical protein LCGC14_0587260 [marine sediment metagenome]|uniref:Actin-like protein N-terminal domain-containing protein n=2 Tax=unclassified sequences TaxID=12908 RepID=A0A0F9REM8_9ZZZZ
MASDNNLQQRPLIIDIGSSSFRLGWAGSDFPDIIAPSIYVDNTDFLFSSDVIEGLEEIFIRKKNTENHLFGHEALKYSNILKIHSLRNNYNILMKFFYFYYQQLEIDEENQFKQPIIILTPFFISELEKTKLRELFFNIFEFPALFFLDDCQGILSILQKTTAVIVNMGENYTYISSFFHGFTNIMARDTYPIAGKDLTNYLLNLIFTQKSSRKIRYLDQMISKEIKEKLSVCVLDPEGEIKHIKDGSTKFNSKIDLPDGSSLEINAERFRLTEPLFDPSKIHIDYIGLHEAISKIIRSWDREAWGELLPNIILSGGSSLIPGLEIRLKHAISKHFSDRLKDKISIITTSGRENLSWVGASVLWVQGKLKKGWENNPKASDLNSNEES